MFTTIRRGLYLLLAALTGWIAVMAVVMRVSNAAPAAMAFLPGEALLAALPDETRILGLNRFVLTVANDPGTAEALYQAGAWLVLPAGLTGCLPLTEAQRRQLDRDS